MAERARGLGGGQYPAPPEGRQRAARNLPGSFAPDAGPNLSSHRLRRPAGHPAAQLGQLGAGRTMATIQIYAELGISTNSEPTPVWVLARPHGGQPCPRLVPRPSRRRGRPPVGALTSTRT